MCTCIANTLYNACALRQVAYFHTPAESIVGFFVAALGTYLPLWIIMSDRCVCWCTTNRTKCTSYCWCFCTSVPCTACSTSCTHNHCHCASVLSELLNNVAARIPYDFATQTMWRYHVITALLICVSVCCVLQSGLYYCTEWLLMIGWAQTTTSTVAEVAATVSRTVYSKMITLLLSSLVV